MKCLLYQVFSWGAGHAEIKHLRLTHGTGNLRALGVRSDKITAIAKVVEGEEERFVVKHWEPGIGFSSSCYSQSSVEALKCWCQSMFTVTQIFLSGYQLRPSQRWSVLPWNGREEIWAIEVPPHSAQ